MQPQRGRWQRAEDGLTAAGPAGLEDGVLSLPASRMNLPGMRSTGERWQIIRMKVIRICFCDVIRSALGVTVLCSGWPTRLGGEVAREMS